MKRKDHKKHIFYNERRHPNGKEIPGPSLFVQYKKSMGEQYPKEVTMRPKASKNKG